MKPQSNTYLSTLQYTEISRFKHMQLCGGLWLTFSVQRLIAHYPNKILESKNIIAVSIAVCYFNTPLQRR